VAKIIYSSGTLGSKYPNTHYV